MSLIILSLLMFLSCSDEKLEYTSSFGSYWDKPTLQKQGLNGAISKITEYMEFEGMRYILSESFYDRNGNIEKFIPVDDFENLKSPSRWLPQASRSYSYEYNQKQLIRINVFEHNENIVSYTFHYGNDERYAIFDLDVKPNSPLLIKNLKYVEASDGSFSMGWDADRLLVSCVSDYEVTETEYVYGVSLYPKTALVRIDEFGVKSEISTAYSFHSNGAFSEVISATKEEGRNFQEVKKFNSDGFVLSLIQSGDLSKQLHYKYNSRNFLTSINHLDGLQDEIGSMTSIYDLDPQNNWIRKESTVEGFIDWDTNEGTEVVKREITYYQ
ncbi:MAG: hypothetical protein ACRCZQ_11090 [Bacteroidales bacterium]